MVPFNERQKVKTQEQREAERQKLLGKVWRMACDHNIPGAVRKSRAFWVCPKCDADVSLEYVLYCEAVGIGEIDGSK